jgi:putative endonuclease
MTLSNGQELLRVHSCKRKERDALHRRHERLSTSRLEHRESEVSGFTKKYGVKMLVYFEEFGGIDFAIGRETRLKKWKRRWKIELIEKANPDWLDLYEKITG